ncbi:MAG: hypothetical protein ACM3PU_13885 [Gemmatimonadota bacterium]
MKPGRTARQKTAPSTRAPGPRNPLVLAARKRAAGPHGPSTKALRQQEKRKLKKLLDQA